MPPDRLRRRSALARLAQGGLRLAGASGLATLPRPGQDAAATARTHRVHGLWVWNTGEVIDSAAELGRLIAAMLSAGATDAYFYLDALDYATRAPALAAGIAQLSQAGLRAWGLEGSRAYFSDTDGPAGLYAAADALVAFNTRHTADERFSGFVADLEPQDGQGPAFPAHFHNGIPDSRLGSRQAADRQALMLDWLQIHHRLSRTLSAAGLPYAAAMPAWTDDYYGEPVRVLAEGRRQDIQPLLMAMINPYLVMCYTTKPERSIRHLRVKLAAAARLGARAPLVYAVVETHPGPGRGISYGDDPTKNSRRAVLADIGDIHQALAGHAMFGGVDLHDWSGWSGLRP